MVNKKTPTKLYSTAEAAALLHVSRVAVFKKIQKGEIKAQKVGRNYVIEPQALSTALNDQLTDEQKATLLQGVKDVVKQYGTTLQLLAKE